MKIHIEKGNIPIYVSIGISIILSLTSYAFVTTTSALRGDVDKVQDDMSTVKSEVSGLKADNLSMQKWLERVEKKLDTAIAK